MREHTYTSEFKLGDQVKIDGGAVAGTVVAIAFYSHDHQVQVSWWNNGALVESWLSSWRCKSVL